MKNNKIFFCNIAYMKYYKGITTEDIPINGGKYIKDFNDAFEKYNFLPGANGILEAFVEPGSGKGGYANGGKRHQIHIERIDNENYFKDKIDDVLVIMCAKSPIIKKTVIVGWYDNATIYRNTVERIIDGKKYEKNIECKNEDAYLIEESKRTFIVPRAKQDGIGFGQSNFWFANGQNDKEFKKSTVSYINSLRIEIISNK